jgi:squalene-hopene/tetraprenyl-beta-curcumene cyclase
MTISSRTRAGRTTLLAALTFLCPAVAAPTFLSQPAFAAAANNDAAAKAKAMAGEGLAFLKKAQQPDGLWASSPREPPGVSALVLRAFANDPATGPKADFVKKAYAALLALQKPDGGIYVDMLSNYNTAIAVSTLAAAGEEYKPAVDKAVAYLKGIQVKDDPANPSYGGMGYGAMPARGGGGGGGAGGGAGGGGRQGRGGSGGGGAGGGPQMPRADLSNTHIFVDAMHDAGLKPTDPAYQEALKFVTRSQNLSETNDQKWAGDDGGFIYTPANGGNSNAGEYTEPGGNRRLRSYGLMTYAGLKSTIYAGLTKDDKRVKAAWDWITQNWTLDEHPGMRAAGADKAKDGIYFYYHTVASALHAYGEPTLTDAKGVKHDWRVELVDKLATLKQSDGSWVGDKSWMENNPVLATSYVVLALQLVQQDLEQRPAK